ncbi:hypothetical protein NGH74_00600 [Staphylococcus pseudoxylosus]|uniref:hypothetical protein n=1 Tax=Staphylococcus pseudoxylosus TaxID=2282419 RepID=UPI002DB5DFF3|nr:hypothetical protein [Staphylococcus pseudoxylosus]MEB8085676.1 hypothetical protein [Staphylococcus pseudoxylosus]
MYKFFNILLIIGLILTVFRLIEQVDVLPEFPGDYLFDKFSIPSIAILVAGIIGTSITKK